MKTTHFANSYRNAFARYINSASLHRGASWVGLLSVTHDFVRSARCFQPCLVLDVLCSSLAISASTEGLSKTIRANAVLLIVKL